LSGPLAAIVSFRLGGFDGVSVEAAKWGWALEQLGFTIRTVAGEGPADHLIAGLAAGADLTGLTPPPVDDQALESALQGVDLVVVENLLSLPLNPAAADAVAQHVRGRPAILHHHDLPWQRARFAHCPPPPHDSAWRHVTINDYSRRELAERGIPATTIANAFDPHPPAGARAATRHALGLTNDDSDRDDWLVVQPTRAIARKGVPSGLALAQAIGATYWLLGPAEEGYGAELARLLDQATVPVRHAPVARIEDAYAASDMVVFPSLSEGFGNPPVEASLHRRPVAVGPYQAGRELAALGFRWFDARDHEAVGSFLRSPDTGLLDHNEHIARVHFSLEQLPAKLFHLLHEAGWA
jgi:glycosyltransferase involved in cell wall biosynthesis